jgi:hypothetical protein
MRRSASPASRLPRRGTRTRRPAMMVAMAVLAMTAGCAALAAAPDARTAETRAYLAALEAQFSAPGVAVARLGGTARLGDIRVRPIAVIEDSRCPRDVTCVWAGRLRLKAAISAVPGEAELTLGEPFALPGGGRLTLVAAAPEPWHAPPPGVETGPAMRFAFRRD